MFDYWAMPVNGQGQQSKLLSYLLTYLLTTAV